MAERKLTAALIASLIAANAVLPANLTDLFKRPPIWTGRKRPPARRLGQQAVYGRDRKGKLYILPKFKRDYMEHPKVRGMLIRKRAKR
jgi:hypothetical protein